MYKNRRKTISSQSGRDSEYETFKMNEFLSKQRRESLSSVDELNNSDFTMSQRMLFATLLTNADKRAKVFELLTNEGLVPSNENVAINNQLRKKNKGDRVKLLSQETFGSPVDKGQKKFKFESPSSRLRRLQLEELRKKEKQEASGTALAEASKSSEDESFEPLPPNEILKGVVAYCEVLSGEEDRSELIKRAMQAMGAEVLDRLNTKKITHVVYRDGSYRTFERARLLKAKLVSVLWIEACRKKGRRVDESKYPALGIKAPEFNLTDVCGRLQDNTDSDSISIVSLSSDSSISRESDVVPSSQNSNSNDLNHLSYANITTDLSPRRSDDLGNQVRNSLELKKIQHIRSPESLSVSKKRQSSVIDENDSIELHITSDESKSRISENPHETKNDSWRSKKRKSSTNSLSNVKTKSNNNTSELSKVPDASKITKSRRKTTFSLPKEGETLDNFNEKRDTKVAKWGRKSISNSQNNQRKDDSGSNRKITNFLQSATNVQKEIIEPASKDKNPGSKSSLETEESFHLHIPSDESKSRSSAVSTTNPIDSSEVPKINENTTEPSKPKRRRLYDPSNYDLNDLDIRWSQEPRTLDLPKNLGNTSKKYRVERPAKLKTPRNLTSNAKKYLQNKSTTCSSSDLSSTEKKPTKSDEKPNTKNVNNRRKSVRVNKVQILDTSSEASGEKQKRTESTNDDPKKTVKPGKSLRIINPGSSTKKKSELENGTKDVSQKVDRRRSVRNVPKQTEVPKRPTPNKTQNKSTSSEKYHIVDGSKSEEKEPVIEKVPTTSRQSVRKKLYGSPDKVEMPKTPRRSMRISIMRTPNKDFVSKVLETPKTATRVLKGLKTEKDTNVTPKTQKTPKTVKKNINVKTPKTEGSGVKKDDEVVSSNVSRVLDKLISKEVCERRSTFEFENPMDQLKPVKKDKEDKKYGTIVCTRLHRQQTEVFLAVVRRLGKFSSHEDEVTKNTTHIIAGDTGRTINLLRAIARGCWILRHEWLLRSAEAGHWLPEKDYELTDFSPAVQFSRMERHVFGKNYKMNILQGKNVWVTAGSSPRKSDLQELIELVGGKIATAPRKADIILGECMPPPAPTCLSETWLLECISKYKFMPYDSYILQGPNAN